jgi:3-phenylpropionate/trans-cinnamate dioxygenase ferredoxin reductase component
VTVETIVIGGAGHAGVQTAVRLRELGFPGRVVMIAPDSDSPYERPPLSKDFLKAGSSDDVVALRKESFFAEKNIERIQARIDEVARRDRTVLLDNGSRIDYSKLVLAPGSTPRPLAVPGHDLAGVLQLKTHQDAIAVKGALRPESRLVVVGAGYIGLEVAAAAATLGCDTTVLEFQDRVMKRVTSAPVSQYFERLHAEKGVKFVFGAAVTEVRGDSQVRAVITADGIAHPADVVVVGIGVLPAQKLASDCGLDVDDGIVVDLNSRTSDPDIYAVGDATRLVDGLSSLRLESIQNAVAQGINAANHVMNTPPSKPEVPWFWTVQHGIRLQTAGIRNPDDDEIVRKASGDQFSVLYVRDGRLAAIDTVGSLRDFGPGKKLIASRAQIDPERAADPSVKLSEAVRELTAREV